jgi:chromate transporter
MMHDEVVTRRGWMEEGRFLDLIGLTNLIPGPNSTEVAMQVGRERAGGRGLAVAGAAFILPASLVALAAAWAYRDFGSSSVGRWVLNGAKPVVVIVVLQALIRLVPAAPRGWAAAGTGIASLGAYLLGANELLILGLGAVVMTAVATLSPSPSLVLAGGWLALAGPAASPDFNLRQLTMVFLKAGAFLYGSGYVLAAFLHNDLVERWRVLSDSQLLDAIAVGQATPGPVFTTATFIGYYLFGFPGAVLATVAIFLPSFLFVAVIGRLGAAVRRHRLASAFLDGINLASLGLMAGVAAQLAVAGFRHPLSLGLGAGAALLLYRKAPSPWVVLGGVIVGVLAGWLGIWD